jgi:hypothetical protein
VLAIEDDPAVSDVIAELVHDLGRAVVVVPTLEQRWRP